MAAKKSNLRELTNEFDVRDALGGNVTGDFETQKAELEKKGKTIGKRVYELAYQMTVQA